jgi:hypothetical protein
MWIQASAVIIYNFKDIIVILFGKKFPITLKSHK